MKFPRRQFVGSMIGLLAIPFTRRSAAKTPARELSIIPSPFVPASHERCFPQPMIVWPADDVNYIGQDIDGNEAWYRVVKRLDNTNGPSIVFERVIDRGIRDGGVYVKAVNGKVPMMSLDGTQFKWVPLPTKH